MLFLFLHLFPFRCHLIRFSVTCLSSFHSFHLLVSPFRPVRPLESPSIILSINRLSALEYPLESRLLTLDSNILSSAACLPFWLLYFLGKTAAARARVSFRSTVPCNVSFSSSRLLKPRTTISWSNLQSSSSSGRPVPFSYSGLD
ncbi:hypothetical protein BJX76DRAFT_340480 [Aspergillus varians]